MNRGNSGGPLLKRAGEVIGVIVLKVTDPEGLAFAVGGTRGHLRIWRACRALSACETAVERDTDVEPNAAVEPDVCQAGRRRAIPPISSGTSSTR